MYDKIGAGEEESPSKLSHRALFEKWRTNGAMNFEKDDADRSLYVLSISVFSFVFSCKKKTQKSLSSTMKSTKTSQTRHRSEEVSAAEMICVNSVNSVYN